VPPGSGVQTGLRLDRRHRVGEVWVLRRHTDDRDGVDADARVVAAADDLGFADICGLSAD
jgi:hypothetical protein